ncbi:MAG: EthD domain-containing protein [Parvibaculales bacterium]
MQVRISQRADLVLKLIYCIRRKDGLDRAQFQKIWREEHGALALQLAEDMGMVRYVQSHTFEPFTAEPSFDETRDLAQDFDGVSECWWESSDAFQAAMATPEGEAAAAAMQADERRFIDHDRSTMFFVEENELLPLATG